jgi:hypothetical protein
MSKTLKKVILIGFLLLFNQVLNYYFFVGK